MGPSQFGNRVDTASSWEIADDFEWENFFYGDFAETEFYFVINSLSTVYYLKKDKIWVLHQNFYSGL